MYELTNETAAGRKYYAKLELGNGTTLINYGDGAVGITSVSLSYTLCGSESVSIGCVNAASVTIVLEAGTALENQRFALYLGQEFDGAVEWVPMGVFTGTKAEVSEDRLTVEAWDDLYFAGGTYTPSDSVTGECTVALALYDVCDQLGIQFLQSSVLEDVTIAGMPTGLTYSAAIGYLAALCGASACMNRTGELEFRQFEESGQTLGTDDCYSGGMVFKTSDFTVASLTNTLETETTDDDGETATETVEVERTTGAAGGSIALTNPLMTENNIDTAWDVVKGFIYRPATLTAVGQLALDVGDVLRVSTLTGGRNYALTSGNYTEDSDLSNWVWYPTDYSANVSLAACDGYVRLEKINSSSGIYGLWLKLSDAVDFQADEKYTITVKYRLSADWEIVLYAGSVLADGGLSLTSLGGSIGAGDGVGEWAVASFTGVPYDYYSSDAVTRYIGFYIPNIENGDTFDIAYIKFEKGTVATDWTPAPEDDESVYRVPVMTHTLEYDGGLKSTITAAGESESQQSAAVSGPVAQQIKELTTKVTDTKVLASGKNAVYYAAAAPSADDYTLSVNDLWFDTSGGDYAPHYWNGSEWVDAPFGSDALGEGSVIASKIAAGEVTAEKINVADLFAQDITATGTISGLTLKGGSISINDLFIVDSDGNLTASNAEITGNILSQSSDGYFYTKINAGEIVSVGYNGATVEALGDVDDSTDDDDDSDEASWYAVLSGDFWCYDNSYMYSTSPDGAVNITPYGICAYYLSGLPWLNVWNRRKTVTVDGSLTVNGFRVPEIQRGTVSMTCTAGGTVSQEITFDQAFSGTPSVLTNPRTSTPGNRQTSASTPSSTGFTLYLYSTASGTVNVDWVAIY